MTIEIFSPSFAGLSSIANIATPRTIGTPYNPGSLTVNYDHNTPIQVANLHFGGPLLGSPFMIAITPLQSSHQLTVDERVNQHEIAIAAEDSVVRALNFINTEVESPISSISGDLAAEVESPISSISEDLAADENSLSNEGSDISGLSVNLTEVFEGEISSLYPSDFEDEETEADVTTDESSDSYDGSLKRSRDSDEEENSNKKARLDDSEEDSGFVGLTDQDLDDIVAFFDEFINTSQEESYISPESTGSLAYSISPNDKMDLSGELDSPFPFLDDQA